MEELENLKKKVENKKNDNNKVEFDYVKAVDSYRLDIKKVYEKVCRAEENLMKKMRYIDKMQCKILELLQENNNNNDIDVEELQKQKEIKKLEDKLRKLKGGE